MNSSFCGNFGLATNTNTTFPSLLSNSNGSIQGPLASQFVLEFVFDEMLVDWKLLSWIKGHITVVIVECIGIGVTLVKGILNIQP